MSRLLSGQQHHAVPSLPWYMTASPLISSLTALWRMDEASGSRQPSIGASVMTQSGTVGSASGPVYSLAAVLESANLETLGTGSVAAIQTGDIDFWVAYWFYPNSTAADSSLFGKDDEVVGANGEYNLNIATQKARWRVYAVGGASTIGVVSSTGSVTQAAWNFVVAYHSATSNLVGISLNGAAFDTSATTGAAGSGVQNLLVGAIFDSAYYDGRVGPLAIGKSYVPVASDVDFLYNGGLGRR